MVEIKGGFLNKYNKFIEKITKIIFCPVCGKKYLKDQLKIKGFFENNFVFQNICSQSHSLIMITSFLSQKNNNKISKEEFLRIKEYLKSFDGDFKNIFNS